MEPRPCELQDAAGRVERCPGSSCPFWELDAGGGDCILARSAFELRGRPELAHLLLDLRRTLLPGDPAPRSLFSLLPAKSSL
jgi:hypothetical protein